MPAAGLYKLALKIEKLDEDWGRFNEAQAAREAEFRRPAKHIDVMSDQEYYRIQDTIEYVTERLKELQRTRKEQLECTRDLVFQLFGGDKDWTETDVNRWYENEEAKKKAIAESEAREKTDEYKKNKAAKRISEGISAALVLRSHARYNPFVRDERDQKEHREKFPDCGPAPDIKRLHANVPPGIGVGGSAADSKKDSLFDFAYNLGLQPGLTPGFTEDNIEEIVEEPKTVSLMLHILTSLMSETNVFQGSLAKAVTDQLKKDMKSGQYPTEAEQKKLEDFFADETAQKAMVVLLAECAMAFNDLAQTLVEIIKIADDRIPENSQPVPKEQFQGPLQQARKEAAEFQNQAVDYFKQWG